MKENSQIIGMNEGGSKVIPSDKDYMEILKSIVKQNEMIIAGLK